MIIAFPHKPTNHGGPGSFQRRFENSIKKLGWIVVYPEDKIIPDVIMILGGTRKLFWLFKMKRKGVSIFFRLGGINWLYKKKPIPFKRKMLIELRVRMIPIIQSYFANGIIYQSEFSKEWLLRLRQSARAKNNTIIYNGVDLNEFTPRNSDKGKSNSLLCVEGNIDYSPYAIPLLNILQEKMIECTNYESLILYGGFENPDNRKKLSQKIDYRGIVDRKDLPSVYKDAVYLSLDVNAACPNTVIEALASGIPVIGFDTGALKELVPPEAGIIVPYGSDPWQLNFPDVDALLIAAERVNEYWELYSRNARKIAKERYATVGMTLRYVKFFTDSNFGL